jgi:hypothetical protein
MIGLLVTWWERRIPHNGEAARAARVDAVDELIEAHERTGKVDQTIWHADQVSRRARWYAAQAERAMELRRSAT